MNFTSSAPASAAEKTVRIFDSSRELRGRNLGRYGERAKQLELAGGEPFADEPHHGRRGDTFLHHVRSAQGFTDALGLVGDSAGDGEPGEVDQPCVEEGALVFGSDRGAQAPERVALRGFDSPARLLVRKAAISRFLP